MKARFISIKSFILVIFTGIILTSCSKDSNPAEDLVGTWSVESISFSVMVGTQTLSDYLVEEVGLTAAEAQQLIDLFNLQMQQSFTGTIEMKSDNTYVSDMGGEDDSGTWSLINDDTQLVIDSDYDDPMILNILEITSSKLRVQGDYIGEEDLNDDDVPETLTITIEITFKKS
jgi:hypothetical protein